MRIVYMHQYFNTPAMHGGTRSYEMARRLVRSGHEVHMVTADSQGSGARGKNSWSLTEEAGIHVHWLPVPYSNNMTYRARVKAFISFARYAGLRAVPLRPDVVFATSTPLTIALPAAYAAKRLRIPLVFEVRDLWPEMPIAVGALRNPLAIWAARRLEHFAYHSSSRIVALSPDMKKGVVQAGYPEQKVTVIPNSCDFDLFSIGPELGLAFRQRYDWLQQRRLIVYTGTLGFVNEVNFVARLAAAVERRDPEIRFLIVGTGREEEKVREEARRLGVLDRTFFMSPSAPKAEIPVILSAADMALSVFKLGIREMWANSANKFFDALAAGKPIAINYGGWQSDLIKETGAGLVLSGQDLETAADQLTSTLNDRVWLSAAGLAAKRLGRERFDRDQLAAELEGVIIDACSSLSN